MRHSHTSVIARNIAWNGPFATEPREVAWAAEAIFFVRILDPLPFDVVMPCLAQISPDGIHWADFTESQFRFNQASPLEFLALTNFGGWLRFSGDVHCETQHISQLSDARFMAYLTLKS